jgi:hypothetical protein
MGKEADEPYLNEDAVACREGCGVYAVSDGASESFGSRRWALVLVRRYVRRPMIDASWIARSIAVYNKGFDRTAMSWSAQAAFDRGSFATLLGLHFDHDLSGVSLLGIGDSLAVLDDGQEVRATYPYSDVEQFRANPLLLSTLHERNQAILDGGFLTHWNLSGVAGARLFCMTDALGAWLLAARDERMGRLRALRCEPEFTQLVEDARSAGIMRRDDTTLLVIG